jgi:hypothetical protein
METKSSRLAKVLAYQSLGFLAIIALCWLDESLNLAGLIFENVPGLQNFQQSALKMLLILAVWLLVSRSTQRLWDRIHYLESFLRVCSWCHRIDYKDKWVPLEEFLEHRYDTTTTHGICPTCFEQQQAIIKRAKAERLNETPPALKPGPSQAD